MSLSLTLSLSLSLSRLCICYSNTETLPVMVSVLFHHWHTVFYSRVYYFVFSYSVIWSIECNLYFKKRNRVLLCLLPWWTWICIFFCYMQVSFHFDKLSQRHFSLTLFNFQSNQIRPFQTLTCLYMDVYMYVFLLVLCLFYCWVHLV